MQIIIKRMYRSSVFVLVYLPLDLLRHNKAINYTQEGYYNEFYSQLSSGVFNIFDLN